MPVPEYQLGDLAEATIVTPVELAFPDFEAPKKLEENASLRVPLVLRFNPRLVKEVEVECVAAFQREREIFMAAVQQCYRRERLNVATVEHPAFAQFLAWVKKRHPQFPGSTNLARAWARGDTGETMLYALLPRLRQAMTRFIRPDTPVLDQPSFLLFTPKSNEGLPDINLIEKRSQKVAAHELYALSEARQELINNVPADEQPLASFLAHSLKPNCVLDARLTERLRQKKAAETPLLVHVAPGEVIVQGGQVIDAKAKAALDALREKRNEWLDKEAAARSRAQKVQVMKDWFGSGCAWVVTRFEEAEPMDYGLWTTLMALLLVLYFLRRERRGPRIVLPAPSVSHPTAYTVILNPHRKETIFLPVKVNTSEVMSAPEANAPVPATAGDAGSQGFNDAQWLERAKDAEERAQELLAMVRAGLAPHLAKELMNKLVQELVGQRNALLETQQIAGREIAAIEWRFNAIHDQLQQQLKLSEKRAQDLEGQLATKDEEAAELLKAMIVNQKKLQSTQSANTGT